MTVLVTPVHVGNIRNYPSEGSESIYQGGTEESDKVVQSF